MIMINKKRYYEGKFETDYEAATQYDKYSLLLNGPKAKTNFSYSWGYLKNIVDEEVDISDLKRLR